MDPIDISFVWGILGKDTGNYMDPDSIGHVIFDLDFDPYAPKSQEFMQKFCHNLIKLEIVDGEYDCFMEAWREIVQGNCNPVFDGIHLHLGPCCNLSFPLNVTMAQLCLTHHITLGYLQMQFGSTLGHVTFDSENQVKVVEYTVRLRKHHTTVYKEMQETYEYISAFLGQELATAPEGMRNGWFGSPHNQFGLYDLQSSLASDTFISIGVSIAIGCFVLLLATCNILLSIYALVCVVFINAVAAGALVLYGWELNIMEAVAFTLAVGLSLGFTVHFAIAFRLLSHVSRRSRTLDAITNVAPAVTMAALTTFAAGTAIYFGKVLAYQQFGIFLMVIMSTSWTFAMFFFLPVCRGIGPSDHCGDLRCCRNKKSKEKHTQDEFKSSQGNQRHDGNIASSEDHKLEQFQRSWQRRSRLPRLQMNQATGTIRGEDSVVEGSWM